MMKYREIYRALERRWQSAPGFRFTDTSGWWNAQKSDEGRPPLRLVLEDRATMRRIWLLEQNGVLRITYMPMDQQGRSYGESRRIVCQDQTHMAQELERLFMKFDTAA